MKIQKLTIHNIASIEDAVIDFEAEPLASSEVFLISGKTGAGKSTILDAICLALYADTPRLDGTRMQGDTRDAEKTVKIDDPRQLMRRHTGEASVLLTFTGSNGIHYAASWAVKRARSKPTGNLQSKEWQLKNMDTGITLNKDQEIRAEIQKAIGLDFSQFCRTTMLAQGEFERFLNSQDDDKAAILEKITGVDAYSRIGAKVYAVTREKEERWTEALRKMEGTTRLTDTQIQEKQDALSQLDQLYGQTRAERDRDQMKSDWLKKEAERSQSLTEALVEVQKAAEVIGSADFKEKETLLKDWTNTRDARRWIKDMEEAEGTRAQKLKALDLLSSEYAQVLGGQRHNDQEVVRLSKELQQVEDELEQEADKAPVYEKAQTIASDLSAIAMGRGAIEKNNQQRDKESRRLSDELLPGSTKAQMEAETAKDSFHQEEKTVKNKEEEVTALNLPGLRAQRDEAREQTHRIQTAKERFGKLQDAKAHALETRRDLERRAALLEEKMRQSKDMDAPIHEAEIIRNTHKEILDKQSDTVHKFARTLRTRLQIGDVCPVCRQKIEKELPKEEELTMLVSGLTDAYDKADKAYQALVQEKTRLDAELKADSAAYKRDLKSFESDDSLTVARTSMQEALKACGLDDAQGDSAWTLLEAQEASTSRLLDELEKAIQKAEAQETQLKKLRKALEGKRSVAEALSLCAQKAQDALKECQSQIGTLDALISAKQTEVKEASQRVQERIGALNWNLDWESEPKAFATQLTQDAVSHASKEQKKRDLSTEMESLRSGCQNLSSVLMTIQEAMPGWKDVAPGIARPIADLLDKANSISHKVTQLLTQKKEAEERLEKGKGLLQRFLAEHESLSLDGLIRLNGYSDRDIALLEGTIRRDRENLVSRQSLEKNALRLHLEHQEIKPELMEEDTQEVLAGRIRESERRLGEIGEQKGSLKQELLLDAENRKRLESLIMEADEKKADYQKWDRLNRLIGDATGRKFRTIAQSYVLSSLIQAANSYMRTLTDRYLLRVTPGTFVITVEDAFQGYAARASSTISGGEKFLVSLSLALALSDIGQSLSVDTLFIDEGFGSLSGEPLQNAIHTLRTLRVKSGQHVGIISHIEEVQEKIPVQIQVCQEGHASSSTIRIVPEVNG